jgi:hypothetical protein
VVSTGRPLCCVYAMTVGFSKMRTGTAPLVSAATPRGRGLLWGAATVLVMLYAYHFSLVCLSAVDVPFWDEWESFRQEQIPEELSMKWLLSRHNEHQILPTRLQTWILYKTTDWNLAIQQEMNFLIFGLVLIAAFQLKKRVADLVPDWMYLLLLCFLLSPRFASNHVWGFQSQFHFFLLFILISIIFLFREEPKAWHLAAGVFSTVLLVLSFSAGVVSAAVIIAGFAGSRAGGLRHARDSSKRKREWMRLLLCCVPVLAVIGLFVLGVRRQPDQPPWTWPNEFRFWAFFTNEISFGFGFDSTGLATAFFFTALVLIPVVKLLFAKNAVASSSAWAIIVSIGAILAALSVIALGRGGHGAGASRTDRYAEIASMLIPLSALAWATAFQRYPRLVAKLPLALLLICTLSHLDNWNFRVYRNIEFSRMAGLRCLAKYYSGKGDPYCPTIYPAAIPGGFDRAREMKVSFYRKLRP